jgi:SRSO17 transposase
VRHGYSTTCVSTGAGSAGGILRAVRSAVHHVRTAERLLALPGRAAPAEGVLVIDGTGDRKWGSKTAHLGRQYLGSRGKVESGIVSVSSLWADERFYYPLHVEPDTPTPHFPKGKRDPAFRTKPQLALELVWRAQALDVPCRAAVAGCLYGENHELVGELLRANVPFVLGLRAREGRWAPALALHTAEEAAHALGWKSEKAGA